MDDLTNKLTSLRHKVLPEWGPGRSDRTYREIARVRRVRRVRNISVLGALAVVGFALGAVQLGSKRAPETARAPVLVSFEVQGPEPRTSNASHGEPAPTELAVTESEVLHGGRRARLADGSTAQVTTAEGSLAVDINQPDHVSMRLAAGTAHFDVVPNTQRRFSVYAEGVEVVVVGTVFDVERSVDRVRVAVSHGKVRVRSPSGTTFVQAGEARWFEPTTSPKRAEAPLPAAASGGQPAALELSSADAPLQAASARPRPGAARVRQATPNPELQPKAAEPTQSAYSPWQASASERAPRPEHVDWRSLSRTGDYDGAYRLLARGAQVPSDPESLMEAADAARLSNHPETAALYLRKVLDQHRENLATPLAAFTLGRVLLERLGRPAEAAEAFAAARQLAPRGSLAQDALAREVESWSKAGHAKEAYDRSRLFMERYPDSRRLRVVQLYGGIETSK